MSRVWTSSFRLTLPELGVGGRESNEVEDGERVTFGLCGEVEDWTMELV